MYPEVEQYIAAVAAADETYNKSPGGGKCSEGTCQVCVRNDAQAAAWESFRASQDSLVRWIAENCEDYRSDAQLILEVLPASMAELNQIAATNEWCGVWEAFVSEAREAGVLPAEATADTAVSA